ncbi:AP2 domain-containing protein, partial [Acinetobacter baumannii]
MVTIPEARRYHRVRADSESGIKGLSYHSSGKWHATLRIDGRTDHLGSFFTQEEAQKAYDEALKKHYPGLAAIKESIST